MDAAHFPSFFGSPEARSFFLQQTCFRAKAYYRWTGDLSRFGHIFSDFLVILETGETPPPANDRKKPVILLLGWAGAKQSHLEKYANIYHKQG